MILSTQLLNMDLPWTEDGLYHNIVLVVNLKQIMANTINYCKFSG